MAGSTRIKGSKLGLTIGGIDYWADITSAVFDNEEADGDVVTFADAQAGGARQHFVTIGAIQSLQTGSFWRYVWANTGATVAYKYAAAGNEIATADEPHLIGTLKVGPKPSLGGEASAANSSYTFETRWDIDDEPELDLGVGATAAITSVTPPGLQVGKQVIIAGTRFTGTTDVKFAAVSALFTLVSDSTIVATIPAGTGAKAVTIITPEGTSASVSYTVAA